MTLDNVLEASTIIFPRSLSLSETKRLFDYIAEYLSADINTKVEYFENRYGTLGKEETAKIKKSRGTVKINGSIRTKNFAFDIFSTIHARNTSKIMVIQFQAIPGYNDLEEYRPEVRELWHQVRVQVQNYFECKKA